MNEFITELKPEPGFLYYAKYVGGSGQTVTLPKKREFVKGISRD